MPIGFLFFCFCFRETFLNEDLILYPIHILYNGIFLKILSIPNFQSENSLFFVFFFGITTTSTTTLYIIYILYNEISIILLLSIINKNKTKNKKKIQKKRIGH